MMFNHSEYQQVSNLRAAIEGVMSLLRRRYHIDIRPVKGLFRLKMKLSTAIISININRLCKRSKNTVKNIIFLLKNVEKLLSFKNRTNYIEIIA